MKPTAADNLQEKIDTFLVTAHEIRTTLTAMKWMLAMLEGGDYGKLSDAQSALLAQASGANTRLINLLNETMKLLRDDALASPLALRSLSLSNLVEESIKDFTSEAATKGMHIRYTPSPAPVIVQGHETKLRIALHNLLDNAIKYGNQNTDITLVLSVDDGRAKLTISDQGVVLGTEAQGRLFEKFYRAPDIRDTHHGLGLGLYATRRILEMQGGTLACTQSTPTETVFELTLPLG